ncbi:MAG: NrfD/PsrC family molybdoenzyme membrane anchor subunit [Syntrophorhabdales bacterium]|jgi:molybdopterin-containing oxidoreductase family membrane subunit
MEHDLPVKIEDVDRQILSTLWRPPRYYWIVALLLFLGLIYGLVAWGYLIATGLGSAGYHPPVMWGIFLSNFIFWIGIAHSGTFISAILYLFRARFRTSINRMSEAMTMICIVIAGSYPLIHLGRSWIFYWLIPYPNQRGLWPDFISPLTFDFLAVSTYFTVSLIFWYTGLVPDLAVIRDRTSGLRGKIYGFLALGWTGSARQWRHYAMSYLLMAGLATALVISVHTVVSWDFALPIQPGWHSTIFPPYFVAGAIHSGLSMVLTLLVPMRRIFRIENIVTTRTLELIAESSIVTAFILFYSYAMEHFMAWYSADIFENQLYMFRLTGYYGWIMWLVVLCAVVAPMLYFFRKFRTDPLWLFIISVVINIGMWWERFIIVIQSLSQNFLPFQWGFYWPNWTELAYTFGTFCLFLLAFMLFAKYLPSIPISEVKKEAGIPTRKGDLFHEE